MRYEKYMKVMTLWHIETFRNKAFEAIFNGIYFCLQGEDPLQIDANDTSSDSQDPEKSDEAEETKKIVTHHNGQKEYWMEKQ